MHIETYGLLTHQAQELAKRAEAFRYENRNAAETGPQCDSGMAHELLRDRSAVADYNGPTASIGGAPTASISGAGQALAPTRSFAPPRTIGWAIKQLHNGARVTRAGWNGRGQFLGLQLPDARGFMTLPYLYIRTVQGDRVPWLASQTDILATDWQLA